MEGGTLASWIYEIDNAKYHTQGLQQEILEVKSNIFRRKTSIYPIKHKGKTCGSPITTGVSL